MLGYKLFSSNPEGPLPTLVRNAIVLEVTTSPMIRNSMLLWGLWLIEAITSSLDLLCCIHTIKHSNILIVSTSWISYIRNRWSFYDHSTLLANKGVEKRMWCGCSFEGIIHFSFWRLKCLHLIQSKGLQGGSIFLPFDEGNPKRQPLHHSRGLSFQEQQALHS